MLGSDTMANRTREFIRRIVIPLDDQFDGDVGAAGGDTITSLLVVEYLKSLSGDSLHLRVEVAEILSRHRADRDPRGDALGDHCELEVREGRVLRQVGQVAAGTARVALGNPPPGRESGGPPWCSASAPAARRRPRTSRRAACPGPRGGRLG